MKKVNIFFSFECFEFFIKDLLCLPHTYNYRTTDQILTLETDSRAGIREKIKLQRNIYMWLKERVEMNHKTEMDALTKE